MKMVRFGADQILSGKGGSYTDEDIDALILRGEKLTSDMQAKLETDAQYNLASFSLMGNDDTGRDTFSFGGENYRDAEKKGFGNFINLPQRERKRLLHDVNDPSGSLSNVARSQAIMEAKKRKKSPTYQDFQLFDSDRLDYFNKRLSDLAAAKEQQLEKIVTIRNKAKHAPSIHNCRSNPVPGESAEDLNELADEMERSLNQFNLPEGKQFFPLSYCILF
jgi:SWI/SNF-related matrix-associated actin-dependent regulator of chromatin subfamily A member 5